MSLTLQTEMKFLKGVGPQRAEVMASRGLHTIGDLLGYLPFRYEDRIHFSKIREIVPGGTYTMQGTVSDCGLGAIHARAGRDLSPARRGRYRSLPCKFFHGQYLERQKRFRKGQRIVLHGKADLDPLRAGPHRNDQSAIRAAGRR